jgi:hypothetical protein
MKRIIQKGMKVRSIALTHTHRPASVVSINSRTFYFTLPLTSGGCVASNNPTVAFTNNNNYRKRRNNKQGSLMVKPQLDESCLAPRVVSMPMT